MGAFSESHNRAGTALLQASSMGIDTEAVLKMILVVAHQQFKALGAEGIRQFCKPEAGLYDLKHVTQQCHSVLMLHRILPSFSECNYYFRRGTAISWPRFLLLVSWAKEQVAQGRPAPIFTFDDGYADNESALQCLVAEGLPAVVFPVRDFVQTGFSPIDDMAAHLNQGHLFLSDRLSQSLLSGKLKACLSGLTAEEYRSYRKCWFGVAQDAGPSLFMTEKQLAFWAKKGVGLGVHGVSHRIWTGLTNAELDQEIQASLSWLKSLGCDSPVGLCMPHGQLDDRVYQALKGLNLPFFGVDRPYQQPVIRRQCIKE